MINYQMFKIDFEKTYHPLYLIDLRHLNIMCKMSNTLMFFLENPKINIDLVSGFFEFYYRSVPSEETLGQILSKALITFSQTCQDMTPCVIFTKGLSILELLIYMPPNDFAYIRELKYFFFPRVNAECVICMETHNNVINIHQDRFNHYICLKCVVKITKCPLCRLSIM